MESITQNENGQIILAQYYLDGHKKEITIDNYKCFIIDKDKEKIADFIYNRFHSRYIRPFEIETSEYRKEYKNGFAIMANSCLMIEALESFKNGWESTDGGSGGAFKLFFNSEPSFSEFKTNQFNFYKNVRCGILHQAETTGGWKINRKKNLLDLANKTISATEFQKALTDALCSYKKKLKNSDWDSEIWDNFRKKMRSVIANCG